MLEEESFSDFYINLCDICNESFALGEKIPESVLEESKNLDTMRAEELMGSLHTFQMNLKQWKKEKTIAFNQPKKRMKK